VGGDELIESLTDRDIEAPERAGVKAIAVMTGGFSKEELCEAGAVEVYESVAKLRAVLEESSAWHAARIVKRRARAA
jgi:hypothetical protein